MSWQGHYAGRLGMRAYRGRLCPSSRQGKPAKDGPQAYDYSGPNPSGAKVGYTAKTGIFKGSFKLYYDGTKGGALQHKAFTVNYAGVLTPKRDASYASWPLGLGAGTVKLGKEKVGIPVELE